MSSVWEDAPTASFEGAVIHPVVVDDDDTNVKDNWDDEDEPAPAAPPPKPAANKAKPKKEDKKKAEKEPIQNLTPEQLAAQRAEAERRVRQVDLELAKEMLGSKINVSDVSFTPQTAEEFDHLKTFIVSLMSTLQDSSHFPDFAENFSRDLAVSLEIDVLKKMSDALSAVLTEKTRQSQQKKTKKAGKGIKLRVGDPLRETGDEELFGGGEDGEDEYDVADKYDFM